MPSYRSLGAFALVVGGLTLFASSASADDDPPATDKPADNKPSTDASLKAPPPATADAHGALEDEHKAYRFVGLRFREVVVPKFMIDIFAEGGTTVSVPMIGAEFGIRKDHLETDFALSYADYSMKPFLFRGKSDGVESNELVSSSMKLLYATIDLLYDVPIDSSGHFSFLFGGGVGLAPVFGSLYRTQTFPNSGISPNDANPAHWGYCPTGSSTVPAKTVPTGPKGVGPNGVPWCDGANSHYGSAANPHSEPSWANGGSKPLIFPWISIPQLSLRYKPVKEFQMRADLGFSITGFFFGLSAAYGL
jgi:hypothetical protein